MSRLAEATGEARFADDELVKHYLWGFCRILRRSSTTLAGERSYWVMPCTKVPEELWAPEHELSKFRKS